MNMTTRSIGSAFHSVKMFNDIGNNFDNVNEQSVDNQLSYIFEELQETITAFEEKNAIEVVDGACDLFVTVVGLMQKLEVAGFDVEEALKRVNENNMSKYPTEKEGIQYPEGMIATLNQKHKRWVLKNAEGKIKKHSLFQSVNLSDCVPFSFFK